MFTGSSTFSDNRQDGDYLIKATWIYMHWTKRKINEVYEYFPSSKDSPFVAYSSWYSPFACSDGVCLSDSYVFFILAYSIFNKIQREDFKDFFFLNIFMKKKIMVGPVEIFLIMLYENYSSVNGNKEENADLTAPLLYHNRV